MAPFVPVNVTALVLPLACSA